jgi:hypothetical protein
MTMRRLGDVDKPECIFSMSGTTFLSWTRLFSGAFFTLTLGLGTHVVMMTVLAIPYPYNPPSAGIVLFANQVLIVLGSLILYQRAGFDTRLRSISLRSVCCFLLLATLTELLIRDAAMNGFVTSAYAYAILEVLPKLLLWLFISILLSVTGRFLKTPGRRLLGSAAIAAVSFIGLKPLIGDYFATLLKAYAYLDHAPIYGFPYGWQVTTAAFITYAEPVSAALVAAWLIFDELPGRAIARVAMFTLIIVMIRGSCLGWLAYGIKHSDRFFAASVSSGQFALESVVLGVLSGLTWYFSRKERVGRTA